MKNKMKSLLGIALSLAFVYLGFYLLNNKVNSVENPTLIKLVAYASITFFGFWAIRGILSLFKNKTGGLNKSE